MKQVPALRVVTATQCQYRGCMKPLPSHSHKDDGKFYCNTECAKRAARYEELRKLEIAAGRTP